MATGILSRRPSRHCQKVRLHVTTSTTPSASIVHPLEKPMTEKRL